MAKQVRQGDVFVERIKSIPKGAEPIQAERIILAHGEVTGHMHEVVGGNAKFFSIDGEDDRYLLIEGTDSRIVHQEHDAIALEKGAYRVRRQREYSPLAIRNVAD